MSLQSVPLVSLDVRFVIELPDPAALDNLRGL